MKILRFLRDLVRDPAEDLGPNPRPRDRPLLTRDPVQERKALASVIVFFAFPLLSVGLAAFLYEVLGWTWVMTAAKGLGPAMVALTFAAYRRPAWVLDPLRKVFRRLR